MSQAVLVDRRLKQQRKAQMAAVVAMSECDPSNPEWFHLCSAMFNAFDSDKSGEIDQKEMRELLELVHPEIPRRLVKEATLQMKQHADHEGLLDHNSFVDALNAAEVYIRDHMDQYPEYCAYVKSIAGSGPAASTAAMFLTTSATKVATQANLFRRMSSAPPRSYNTEQPSPEVSPTKSSSRQIHVTAVADDSTSASARLSASIVPCPPSQPQSSALTVEPMVQMLNPFSAFAGGEPDEEQAGGLASELKRAVFGEEASPPKSSQRKATNKGPGKQMHKKEWPL